MLMSIDSHFEIGSSHSICEDYANHAVAESEGHHWCIGVLSDGCSGSPYTDFGSRIMAHNVLMYLGDYLSRQHESACWDKDQHFIPPLLISGPVRSSLAACRTIGLPDSSLDATLWVMIGCVPKEVDEDGRRWQFTAFVWGDGSLVARRENSFDLSLAQYPSSDKKHGAPYYVNYELDEDRKKNYPKQFASISRTPNIHVLNDGEVASRIPYLGAPLCDPIDCSPCNWYTMCSDEQTDCNPMSITVFSDGLETYNQDIDEEVGSSIWAARDLTDFKNTEGRFMLRRMKAMQRRYRKKGIVHKDDLSAISIIFPERFND